MRTPEQADLILRLRGYAAEVQAKAPIKRRRVILAELEGDAATGLLDKPFQGVAHLLLKRTSRPRSEYMRFALDMLAQSYEQRYPIEEERMPRLSWPVENGEALVNPDNPFGANPELYAPIGYSGHPGIDFSVPVGTPIMAAADGYVAACGEAGTAGYRVELRHDALGCTTRYCHLSWWDVEIGQEVQAAQTIGLSGGQPGEPGAGYTEGPHLHLDVWDDNEPADNGYGGRCDPLLWLTVDPETVLA